MISHRMFLLLSVLLLLSACSPVTQPSSVYPTKRVTVTEEDDGRTVTLSVGDSLAVVLDSNPSTGYAWEVEGLAQGVLERAGDVQEEPKTALLGVGGEDLFLFNAVGQGRTEVRLVYRRPFEQAEPKTTFEITVLVN